MLSEILSAWTMIDADQRFIALGHESRSRLHSRTRAYCQNPSIRAAFWMRLATSKGSLGLAARAHLIAKFSCDVSRGAKIDGALHLPHPIGITIGQGIRLTGPTTVYQNVTLGGDRKARYPDVGVNVTFYPNAVAFGGVRIEDGTTVGAGVVLNRGTVPFEIVGRAAT